MARCQRRGRWGERVVPEGCNGVDHQQFLDQQQVDHHQQGHEVVMNSPRRSRSGVIVLRVEMHGGQRLSVAHLVFRGALLSNDSERVLSNRTQG